MNAARMTTTQKLKRFNPLFAILTIGAMTAALFIATDSSANAAQAYKYSIALIGDMPYDAKGVTQTPNVINEINASRIDLTLFDGDTMSGKGDKCTDAAYPALKTGFFDKFFKPLFALTSSRRQMEHI